jgi:RNA polymerase sigma-70 factor (ECF subfamily)
MTEVQARAKPPDGQDAALAAALRRGDERAFSLLVEQHHAALLRLAAQYVASAAIAEEVVQDTWITFVQGLDRFEGRSSLKTWLFGTLFNCARNRRRKEIRSVPFSSVWNPEEPGEPAFDPSRFRSEGTWAGNWVVPFKGFSDDAERRLLNGELEQQLRAAIDLLPAAQREVITLRDVEGFSAEEVCELLDLTEANQRVLLHRARARVRATLERYLAPADGAA